MKNSAKFLEPIDSSELVFRCKSCVLTFNAVPTRCEEEPNRAHPFRYFAHCENCLDEVEQVAWQVGMLCANACATGPKTPEGKAKSAANLSGHPTPDEAKITRFNALQHGASAKTAILFPARPGKYPHCETCSVDHDYCRKQPACLKRTELFMKHFVAMQSDNPDLLKDIHAANQAGLSALFEDMLVSIVSDGVTLRNPAYSFSKDGDFRLAKYTDEETGKKVLIEEIKAHPLLKPLFELISKNSLSLADLNMTPKVQMDQGIAAGNLDADNQSKEQMTQFQEKQTEALENMRELISRSQDRIKKDPVLVEFENMEESDE